MKQSILVCDACPQNGQVHVAQDRIRITGLLTKPMVLDLCEEHLTKVAEAVEVSLQVGKKLNGASKKSGKTLTEQVEAYIKKHDKGDGVTVQQLIAALPDYPKQSVTATAGNLHLSEASEVFRLEKGLYGWGE